ncbi:hypothetical protein PG985_010215 [Apiospora marii]|uniref:uncharacterized protein n=1 Tax=Apiospora marii TaxID=335849 RepID=UPI00312D8D90
MPNAVHPDDFIGPDPRKRYDIMNRSDQATTKNTQGKAKGYMARANQQFEQTMTSIRHDINTFKGYFRGVSDPPNTSDKQNKSSVVPAVSQGDQPPTPSDTQSSHPFVEKPVATKCTSTNDLSPDGPRDQFGVNDGHHGLSATSRPMVADAVDAMNDAKVDEDVMEHTGNMIAMLN